jgi:hypothetical protein
MLLNYNTPFNSIDIITETNKIRISHNLPELKINNNLTNAAILKLNDMTTNNYFAHINPQGLEPWFWIEKSGYNYTHAGENLAFGFYNAKETLNAWMNSPTHRENILNLNYKDIGVAVAKVKINQTEGFLIVQMFGKSGNKTPALTLNTPTNEKTKLPQKQSAIPTLQLNNLKNLEKQTNTEEQNLNTKTLNQEKTEPVKLQYVSTDNKKPVILSVSKSNSFLESIRWLENLYRAYLIIIIVMLAILILTTGLNKKIFFPTIVNLIILIISILIPPIEAKITKLIF